MSTDADPPFSEEQMAWLRETFTNRPVVTESAPVVPVSGGSTAPSVESGKLGLSGHGTLRRISVSCLGSLALQ